MFNKAAYNKLNESDSSYINKFGDNEIKNNSNKSSEVIRVMAGVANTPEIKDDRKFHHFYIETKDIPTKDIPRKKYTLRTVIVGALTGLGVGTVIGTAIGILSTSERCNLITGGQNTGIRSGNMSPHHFSDVPAPVDRVLLEAGDRALTTAGYALRSGVNSTLTPETSLPPTLIIRRFMEAKKRKTKPASWHLPVQQVSLTQ